LDNAAAAIIGNRSRKMIGDKAKIIGTQ